MASCGVWCNSLGVGVASRGVCGSDIMWCNSLGWVLASCGVIAWGGSGIMWCNSLRVGVGVMSSYVWCSAGGNIGYVGD